MLKSPFSARYLVTLALLAGTFIAWRATARGSESLAAPLKTLGNVGDWEPVSLVPLGDETLRVVAPTDFLSGVYRRRSLDLGLLIVYYANQRAGENLHSPRNCLPGSGWEIRSYGSAFVPVADNTIGINKFGVQNGSFRMLVLYWYQSRKHIFANEYLGKLLLVRDALLDGTTSGSLVRITLPDTPEALKEGVNFASVLIPRVQKHLNQVPSTRGKS